MVYGALEAKPLIVGPELDTISESGEGCVSSYHTYYTRLRQAQVIWRANKDEFCLSAFFGLELPKI